MGYIRGNMPPGITYPSGWIDTLEPGQVELYLEFKTPGPNGSSQGEIYNFDPLFTVTQNQQERHSFEMTEDPTGHYYAFYLDGAVKWEQVYQWYPMNTLIYGNEDLNYDPYCDPGYADNNYFSLPMYNPHADQRTCSRNRRLNRSVAK